MIVILYDPEISDLRLLALKIKGGIDNENQRNLLMPLNLIDEDILDSAKCIIFGCHSGINGDISTGMLEFMNSTSSKFHNQIWKNKLAAGFTTGSQKTIEDLCNFAAKNSMIWITQGHLAENEGSHVFFGSSRTRVNSNRSFLGCISMPEQYDLTASCFGTRIAQQCSRFLM